MSLSSAVAQLKVSHQLLTESISQTQLFLRSYPQAKQELRVLYQNLLNHFSRQDQRFYDRLTAFYAGDRPSLKMLEFLILDIKDLKIRYLVFSEQHSGEMIGGKPRNFPKDFMEFAQVLLARVRMEEEYLLPLVARWEERAS